MLLSQSILKKLFKVSLSAIVFPCLTLTSLQASDVESTFDDRQETSSRTKRTRHADNTLEELFNGLEIEGTTRESLFLKRTKHPKRNEISENDPTQDPTHPENFPHLHAYWLSDNPDEKELARRAYHDIALNHPHAFDAALILHASDDPFDQEIAQQSLNLISNNPDHPQHFMVLNYLNNKSVEEETLERHSFTAVDIDHAHSFSGTSTSSHLSCTASSSEFCMRPSLHPQYCTDPNVYRYGPSLIPTDSLSNMGLPEVQPASQQPFKDSELTSSDNEESVDARVRHLYRKNFISEAHDDSEEKLVLRAKIKRLKAEALFMKNTAPSVKETLAMWDQGKTTAAKKRARDILAEHMTKGHTLTPLEQKRIIRRFKDSQLKSDQTLAKSWAQKYLTPKNTQSVQFNDKHQYRDIPSRYEAAESSIFFKTLKSLGHGVAAVFTMMR